MKCTRERTRAGRTSTPRTDARSISTCPTTTANAHNPSIPPIGGEGRLHDSAGPPIFFPSLDPVRGAGVEPALQAWKASVIPLDYPRAALGHSRGVLESFPAGRFLDGAELVLGLLLSPPHGSELNVIPVSVPVPLGFRPSVPLDSFFVSNSTPLGSSRAPVGNADRS